MLDVFIRTARKRAKLSQPAFARKLALSPRTIRRWELGEAVPTFTQLVAMSELLGDPLLRTVADERLAQAARAGQVAAGS